MIPSWWTNPSGRRSQGLGAWICKSLISEALRKYQPSPASSQLWKSTNNFASIKSTIMKPATLRPFLPRPAVRRRTCISRNYAVQSPGSPTLQVFNRHTKYLQKERAAANVVRSRQTDYVKDEVAVRLSERLLVSFNCQVSAQKLRNAGYKSTFQPCSRPRRKLLQHSASTHSPQPRP